uniref:GAF domain-containing protein n=1 Tax=Trichocoleus desertorum TaxID=1481672 RepID=UPI0025B5CFE5|nr:GAF domain-containing protein [Trichocoleus desertorum]
MQPPESVINLEPSQTAIAPTQDDGFWEEELSRAEQESQPALGDLVNHSQFLMAAIAPQTFALSYANESFWKLLGAKTPQMEQGQAWLQCLAPEDVTALQQLYRGHLLRLILSQHHQTHLPELRFLDQPIRVTWQTTPNSTPRYLSLWLRSQGLRVAQLEAESNKFADLNHLSPEALKAKLLDEEQLRQLEQRLDLSLYPVEGQLLLEGLDITAQEAVRRLTYLLIDRDSILRPEKFQQVNQGLRSLFRADNSIILSAEGEQARLFIGTEYEELNVSAYSMASLQGSHFLKAAEVNQVYTVPDLHLHCQTECERNLQELGIRSLLLIPLVVKATATGKGSRQLAGLVGLTSDRPHHFDSVDCQYATELIAPLTVALRQAAQQQLTTIHNIHPAVEWRFLQEAERQSWGLPPEPVVFANVYPLYGISDIRGSSDERNRAIQADLLEQFRLGLAVVDAVCQYQETALGEQLRLDLLEHIERLQAEITVDAEMTALKYLSDRLEVHFDSFAQCGPAAQAAVAAYRTACSNEQKSVYVARSQYDQVITQINTLLRATWERWQVRMQEITAHYCDIECTDGIDHMIYAGASIDAKFGLFHLHSLRYEQLRAVCDCARTALSLESQYNTKMQVTHLVLVQDSTVDIFHEPSTERLFDVRGTRDTRYEIVKKRIDKALDQKTKARITQPGMLTLVYSTEEEWAEYQQYWRYLMREGWIGTEIATGNVEPLQGVNGLKFVQVQVLPA